MSLGGILGAVSIFDIATDQSKFVFKLKLINLLESVGKGVKALGKEMQTLVYYLLSRLPL
ncbi:hypothetical protein GCM10010096_20400 [Alcaligenes pakistanensis]|uniref:Uncharacterized protein n=1 Tax=Alcaligenes pakistanensis TaxID=1482717 RepID=A0A8H9M7T6_9BURK|nr:hypothetical protein GCM10010096_20400 [Alcaligenes pakistanensis]HCA17625.1 hypothetical protein [Alcaligenes faecalis]